MLHTPFLIFKEISFLEELEHCMAEKSPTITDIKRCLERCEISCSVLHLISALRLFLTQLWDSSPQPLKNLNKFVHALKLNTWATKIKVFISLENRNFYFFCFLGWKVSFNTERLQYSRLQNCELCRNI